MIQVVKMNLHTHRTLTALTKFQDNIEENLCSSEDEDEKGDKDFHKACDELLLKKEELARANYKLKNEKKKLLKKLQNIDSPKKTVNESEPN